MLRWLTRIGAPTVHPYSFCDYAKSQVGGGQALRRNGRAGLRRPLCGPIIGNGVEACTIPFKAFGSLSTAVLLPVFYVNGCEEKPMPEQPTLDKRLLHLKLDGWCVVDNVVPEDAVGSIREKVTATTRRHRRSDAPAKIGHRTGLINYDQSFAQYLVAPHFMALIEAVLGPPVRVSFTSAMINYPGNERGGLHADWPFNQRNAGHMPVPYPDIVAHLTTLWMLSPFTAENGATIIVPGSHRMETNPSAASCGHDADTPYPTEIQATGKAGSVLVMDSRMWHAAGANRSESARVAMAIRFAPWWLNLKGLMPGSGERARLTRARGLKENEVEAVKKEVFSGLSEEVQPLFAHWVEQ